MKNRYNRLYSHGKVSFFLSDYYPNIEECRFLILKVVEQAVRDYLALYNSEITSEKDLWETAAGFIFDPTYTVWWGDMELTLENLLEIVDLDISWFRERVIIKFRERHGEHKWPAKRNQTSSPKKRALN